MSLRRDLTFSARYWRQAYELLVAQTGRDLNDGLGLDPRVARERMRHSSPPSSDEDGPGRNKENHDL